MLENFISNFRLIDLFWVIIIYNLAVFIGIFIKKYNTFYYPVIFGLMYGNYMAIRLLLMYDNILLQCLL